MNTKQKISTLTILCGISFIVLCFYVRVMSMQKVLGINVLTCIIGVIWIVLTIRDMKKIDSL